MPSFDLLCGRLFLLGAAEPPAPVIHHYVAVHGPIDTVAHIQHGTAPQAVLAEITRSDPRIEDDLRALDKGTARLLTPEDDDWPIRRLASLSRLGAPLALWVRGTASLPDLTSPAVTVTGARAASAYGNTVAADFGHDLQRRPDHPAPARSPLPGRHRTGRPTGERISHRHAARPRPAPRPVPAACRAQLGDRHRRGRTA